MNGPGLLVVLALVVPLLLAMASMALPRPARLLPWSALPGLLCALAVPAGTRLELPVALLGAALQLDPTGAVFLGFSSLLWSCAGLFAQAGLAGHPRERSFCIFWQLTLAGSLGTFLAADVITFYVAFACVSLPAYVLVIHERSPESLRAGRVYITLALFGEIALLAGLMLAARDGGIIIHEVQAALPDADQGLLALLCILAGVGLKAGLVPLHGWLPLAHSAAPVPASAVLSGAIVKAGIIGVLRFLPMDGAMPVASALLAWVGLLTAWAGVLLGVVQQQPKPVLAYSTMSQMGLLVAVIGAGSAAPGLATVTYGAAALFALHHGLAKGALFLSVGLLKSDPNRRRILLLAAAVLGAAIAGLPLSGGALAKLAIKDPLGTGVAAQLAAWSAVGTMLLMLRFLWLAAQKPGPAPAGRPPRRELAAFAVLAVAALVLPWSLLPWLAPEAAGHALQGAMLWSAFWPLLLAAALAAAAWRIARAGPPIPVGDVAAWVETAWTRRRAGQAPRVQLPATSQRTTDRLRGWQEKLLGHADRLAARMATLPVGAASLALLALLLAASLA